MKDITKITLLDFGVDDRGEQFAKMKFEPLIGQSKEITIVNLRKGDTLTTQAPVVDDENVHSFLAPDDHPVCDQCVHNGQAYTVGATPPTRYTNSSNPSENRDYIGCWCSNGHTWTRTIADDAATKAEG